MPAQRVSTTPSRGAALARGRWRVLAAAAGFALTVTFGVLEFGVRLLAPESKAFTRPDSTVGFSLVPNASFTFRAPERCIGWESRGRVNSKGLRDVERSYQKAPGTTRILVLGDSYAEALMFDYERTFCPRLERALRERDPGHRYEVVNAGRSAMGTGTEYLFFEDEGYKYGADLVLLLFTPNDFADNSRELNDRLQPYFYRQDDRLRLDRSFLDDRRFLLKQLESPIRRASYLVSWAVTRSRLSPGAAPNPRQSVGGELTPAEQDAIDVTGVLIQRLASAVEREGAELAIVIGTSAADVNFSGTARSQRLEREADAIVSGFARAEAIPVLSLEPSLRAHSAAQQAWIHGCAENGGWGHWSERGHQLAADETARFLLDARLLAGPRHGAATAEAQPPAAPSTAG